jgi:predicted transcriptional regulator of viral defense system
MRSHLADLIDAAEKRGKLNMQIEDIAKGMPGVSPEALRQALQRQQQKGRIVRASRGSGHWVIVPRQDASVGAPPLEAWLDPYLSKSLELAYYVGLLSAAEAHGVSPQAVMVTQVMVSKTRRAVRVGRHRLVFHERGRLEAMPTQWHETSNGRFKVSTPELTAIELVSRQQLVGGASRAYEVVRRLADSFSQEGLTLSLEAVNEVPSAQRLGALLARADKPVLASLVRKWLQGKRIRVISLSPGDTADVPATMDIHFKVRIPDEFLPANA